MEDIVIIAILALIAVGIGIYLYRAKQRGEKCVGCPYCKQCCGTCNIAKDKYTDKK